MVGHGFSNGFGRSEKVVHLRFTFVSYCYFSTIESKDLAMVVRKAKELGNLGQSLSRETKKKQKQAKDEE